MLHDVGGLDNGVCCIKLLYRQKETKKQEKSSVAEHALAHPGHKILFDDDTEVLCNTHDYLARLHREAIEIHKHINCFKKKKKKA